MDSAPDSTTLAPGLLVGGRYRILRELGSGAMGSVYEAEGPDGLVALKTVLKGREDIAELQARFNREIGVASSLQHPHVLPILDHGVDAVTGAPYYVMPRVRGLDLGKLLARVGVLDPHVAVALVAQACRGVAAGHEAGIVHRDIKPSNLLLAERGEGYTVLVGDFGLAKNLHLPMDSLTTSGALLGSPHYMAPEQSENAKRVDARADVYSLGMVLYALLAGAPAFSRAGSFLAFVVGAAQVPPLQRAAPWVSPEIARVVHAALLRKPEARWPSVGELELGLAGAVGYDTIDMTLTRAHLEALPEGARHIEAEKADIPRSWDDLLRR